MKGYRVRTGKGDAFYGFEDDYLMAKSLLKVSQSHDPAATIEEYEYESNFERAERLEAENARLRAEVQAAKDAARAAQDANSEAGNTIAQLQAEKWAFEDELTQLRIENEKLKENHAHWMTEEMELQNQLRSALTESQRRERAAVESWKNGDEIDCGTCMHEGKHNLLDCPNWPCDGESWEWCGFRTIGLPVSYSGTIHHLKTVQPYYDASESGIKTFEMRKDDRGYAVGDILHLYEWDREKETGRSHYKQVTYILRDAPYVPDGYVCLAVFPITAQDAEKGEAE